MGVWSSQFRRSIQNFGLLYSSNVSCDKGSVERHNELICIFISKGEHINEYSLQDIINIETWCNLLLRKLLAYHTWWNLWKRIGLYLSSSLNDQFIIAIYYKIKFKNSKGSNVKKLYNPSL